jgi:hypothetical protein
MLFTQMQHPSAMAALLLQTVMIRTGRGLFHYLKKTQSWV